MNWTSYWLGVATPFAAVGLGFLILFVCIRVHDWFVYVPLCCGACGSHVVSESWVRQPDVWFRGWPWQRWTQWYRHRWSKEHLANAARIHRNPDTCHSCSKGVFRWRGALRKLFIKEEA